MDSHQGASDPQQWHTTNWCKCNDQRKQQPQQPKDDDDETSGAGFPLQGRAGTTRTGGEATIHCTACTTANANR